MRIHTRLLSLASLTLLAPLLAGAHTHIESSVPADNARVAAPKKLELKFADTVQLQSVTLQQGSAAARRIQPLPKDWGSQFSLPLESLPAGDYLVNWTVSSEDGHTASGKLRFTIVAPAGGQEHQH